MSFLLVPNEVRAREVNLWLGVANENVDVNGLTLFCNGVNIPIGAWLTHRTINNIIHYQQLQIPDLEPRSDHRVELFLNGASQTTATFRTLPEELPTVNETPFTVLLASCFCLSNKTSTALGSTYLKLRNQKKIDMKILCGDQVYLDDPTEKYYMTNGHFSRTLTWRKHPTEVLSDRLLSTYVQTWGQSGTLTGFQGFLQNGANFFSSDDHEFWNNAPSRATLIPDTWHEQGRDWWWTEATNLLKIFQPKSPHPVIKVGAGLSFFIADTRVNRKGNDFMSPDDLKALRVWVRGLSGVGVLVLGQPIFSKKAGALGNLTDWNLPDFDQYEELVKIIFQTEHSILMLTGDVHYGRISRCQLKPGIFLYEIISSPTALVDPRVGGKWHPAPETFPSFAIPGVVQQTIENNFGYQFTNHHFLILDFYKDGAKTKVVLNTVEISGEQAPTPSKIDEFTLL